MLSNETIRELAVIGERALNLAQRDKFRDIFSSIIVEVKREVK